MSRRLGKRTWNVVLCFVLLFVLLTTIETERAEAGSYTVKKGEPKSFDVTWSEHKYDLKLDGAYTSMRVNGCSSWISYSGSGQNWTITIKENTSESKRTGSITFQDTRSGYSSWIWTVNVSQGGKPHTHSWGAWSYTSGTCTSQGSRTRKCSCGEKQTESTGYNSSNHGSNGTKTKTVNPTCTADGYSVSVCKGCGAELSSRQKKDKLGHNWGSWETDKDSTCAATGSKHRVCQRCGDKQSETIAKKAHTWGNWVTDTDSTCSAVGSKHRVCTKCSERENGTIEKKNHTNSGQQKKVPATCTTDGYTVSVCAKCGAELGQRTTIKAAHTWGDWKVDKNATCTATGSKSRSCSKCGEKETDTIKELGHLVEGQLKTVPATCTKDGYKVIVCSRCGVEQGKREVIKAGHSWNKWVVQKEAGCETAGTKYRTCKNCSAKEMTTIPKLDHLVNGQVKTVPATCVKDGYQVVVCSRCGKEQGEGKVLKALGHSMGKWEIDKDAGCETAGTKHRTCTRKGCNYREDGTIDPKGHSFNGQRKVVPATCTKDGYSVVKCSNCSQEAQGRTILPALGHDWGAWNFNHDETCEKDGTKYRFCKRCSLKDDGTVPKTGHHELSQPKTVAATCVSDGYRVIVCRDCGKDMGERTILPKTGIHSLGAWVTTKEETCEEDGSKYRKCINCTYTETASRPKLGHLVAGQRKMVVPPNGGTGVMTIVCSRCGKPMGNDAIFDVPKPTEAPKATVDFVIKDNRTNEDVGRKTVEVKCGQAMGDVFPKVKNPKKRNIVAWVDIDGNYYNQYTVLTSTNRVVLYPKWRDTDHYTIILHGNGAKNGSIQYLDVPYGEEYTLPAIKDCFDDGVGFEGWGTAPDGGKQVFSDLAKRTNFAGSESSITLYALWNSGCSVTYHDILRGTTVTEQLTHTYKVKGPKELPQFNIIGVKFVRWSKQIEPNSRVNGDDPKIGYSAGDEIFADGNNLDLYPVYTSNKANYFAVVFYDTKQKKEVTAQHFLFSSHSVSIPQVIPTYDERYVLDGWMAHPGFAGAFALKDVKYRVGKSATLSDTWGRSYIIVDSVWKRSVPVKLYLNYGYDHRVDIKEVDTDEYKLPSPERNGYTFCGWREHPDDPETDVGEIYTVPDQGGTLYAAWEPIIYTVEYYDGLTGEMIGLPEKLTINDTIRSSAPQIDGMTWCGWATGRVVPYNPNEASLILKGNSKYSIKVVGQGKKVSDIPHDQRKIVLYSLYTLSSSNKPAGKTLVLFHPGNGNQSRKAVWLLNEGSVQLPSLDDNLKGGVFNGWKWNNQTYKAGKSVNISRTSSEIQVVVFVAQWTAKHKITLDPNYPGATKVDLSNKYLTNGTIRTKDLSAGERKGYTLVGWEAVQEHYCRPYGMDDEIFIPNQDLTLIAIWRKNEYKVIYHSGFNGYIGSQSDSCERTKLIFDERKLNWLKKPGYIFVGWTLEDPQEKPWDVPDSKIITIQDNPEIVLEEDLHVYSCYKVDPTWKDETRILFTYNWMGGIDGPEDEYFDPTLNNYHVSKVIPKRAGYYFEGWTLKEFIGENVFIDDSNCGQCVNEVIGYLELYASWRPKEQNNMMAYFQGLYGKNKMPDFYFLTEYESPEWERINDYCYFAIKTTRLNNSEHFKEFDSLVLVIEYRDGMWQLTGRSASTDWRESLEYDILIHNKDKTGKVIKVGADAAITLLSEHPVFKYFVMGLDVGSMCAATVDATKKSSERELAVIRLASKVAKSLFKDVAKECKDTEKADDFILEAWPFIMDVCNDTMDDGGWSIVSNTVERIGQLVTIELDHPEAIIHILEAADEQIDIQLFNKWAQRKMEFLEKYSDFSELQPEKAELFSTGVSHVIDACTLVVSSIMDNIDYSKAIKKQMDPFGEMHLALATFYAQLDDLQFGKAIVDGFPVVIEKIYNSYCKLK